MKKTTLFVDLKPPLKKAVEQTAFGTTPISQLRDDQNVEANIAVTNSVAKALKMITNTEKTVIVIMCLSTKERAMAQGLASRFPTRVHALIASTWVIDMLQIIATVAKEED